MPTQIDLDLAREYFSFALSLLTQSIPDEFVPVWQINNHFRKEYKVVQSQDQSQTLTRLVDAVLDHCKLNGNCDIVRDDFAPTYVKLNREAIEDHFSTTQLELFRKYSSLGKTGHDWLCSALARILNSTTAQEIDEHFPRLYGRDQVETNPDHDDMVNSTDTWAPLQIDRQNEAYRQAIELTETAVATIESSNGYASSEPEERNGIVATLRGSLELIKTGFPSKEVIKQTLLAPIQYIARKFVDSAMGEVAKAAAAAIIKWLASF